MIINIARGFRSGNGSNSNNEEIFWRTRYILWEERHIFGMDITITDDNKIKVEMKDQLNEAIDTFATYGGEISTESVTSPAQKYLRIVNKECKELIRKKREMFHTILANLSYITKRSRLYLDTAI